MTGPPTSERRPGRQPERRPTRSEIAAAAKPLELFDAEGTAERRPIARAWDAVREHERRTRPVPQCRRRDSSPVVWVEIGQRYTSYIEGERIVPALKVLNVPYHWHPHRRDVICCPTREIQDVIAYLQHRRRRVEIVQAAA